MTTIESAPDVPSHEQDDRIETTRHLIDMLNFVHADVAAMTAEELHNRYLQAHAEVHRAQKEEEAREN
jgi:hypothetical protein